MIGYDEKDEEHFAIAVGALCDSGTRVQRAVIARFMTSSVGEAMAMAANGPSSELFFACTVVGRTRWTNTNECSMPGVVCALVDTVEIRIDTSDTQLIECTPSATADEREQLANGHRWVKMKCMFGAAIVVTFDQKMKRVFANGIFILPFELP